MMIGAPEVIGLDKMTTKTILVVDDHEEVRELVKVTLEILPYQILSAGDGHQALHLARTALPDLILLDIRMPGELNGLDVCRLLKTDPRTQGIYVIILTGKGQEWDIAMGYSAGADIYLTKPFSPLELMGMIENVLEA